MACISQVILSVAYYCTPLRATHNWVRLKGGQAKARTRMLQHVLMRDASQKEAIVANFLIVEVDNKFAVLPDEASEIVLFQFRDGSWYAQPLPEESWEVRAWFWGENPLEMILTKNYWQPLPEGEERKLPTEAARLGWAWVLSSRGTR